MKNTFLCISVCLLLNACNQLTTHNTVNAVTVTYDQLTAQKNYWDSIPGRVKVRDRARPYRYYFNGDPYTGKVQDYFSIGRSKLIGTFKDGYAEGPWKYYQQNDSLEQMGVFENGYVKGEWRFYDRKGREDTRLSYHLNGRYITADTLMVVYTNGIRKVLQKDSIYTYYHNGAIKSCMTTDGSAGREWDDKGNMIAETKGYIKYNNMTQETTYYVAQGRHQKAYKDLLDHNIRWTDEEKEAFKKANSVTVTKAGALSANTYGYKVKVN